MRSVFVFLRHANAGEVQDYLERTYSTRRETTWVLEIVADAALYINAYNPHDDPKTYNTLIHCGGEDLLVKLFGRQPSLIVSADVSGRHPGDKEVRDFVYGLLDQFEGVVMDEYTDHFWTLEQVKSDYKVQGHPFFDYCGWYKEWRSGKT